MAGKPRHHCEDWTKQEIKKLRSLANAGASTPQIASELGRTKDAIYNKASSEDISLKPKDKSGKRREQWLQIFA